MTGHRDILRRTRQSHWIEKFDDIHDNNFPMVRNFIGLNHGGHNNYRSIGKSEYIHEVAAIALTA